MTRRRLFLNRQSFTIARRLDESETIDGVTGQPGDYAATLPGTDRETIVTASVFCGHWADPAEAFRDAADLQGAERAEDFAETGTVETDTAAPAPCETCGKCGQPKNHPHHDADRWPGRISTNHPYHGFVPRNEMTLDDLTSYRPPAAPAATDPATSADAAAGA